MSVDMSGTIGVGAMIDATAFDAWRSTQPDEENYGDEELLEELLKGSTGLCFGAGGSYYDNKLNQLWIAVKSQTSSFSDYDIPGGVTAFATPKITLEERLALDAVMNSIGQPGYVLTQFVSILWC